MLVVEYRFIIAKIRIRERLFIMNQAPKDICPGHMETARQSRELSNLVQRCRKAFSEGKSLNQSLTPQELDELRRRYSHFEDRYDDRNFLVDSSHVVTKVSTPRPYIHLMCSNHSNERGILGSFWDQSGSGFSSLDSVLAGPITSHKDISYVPTAPRATDHRSFFLREQLDEEKTDIWHMIPQRGREEEAYDSFRSDQGLGYVRTGAVRNGISSELLVFVPVVDPLEVWRLRLANHADRSRKLSLFVSINWGLESYPGYYFDPRVVSHGQLFKQLNALLAFNNDKNNKHPRTGFLMSSKSFDGFDMSAEDFTGGGHFRLFPRAVEEGFCRGSMGVQPYQGLIAALQFDLHLEFGEEIILDFLLGATSPDPEKAKAQLAGFKGKYFDSNGLEQAFAELERSWSKMVSRHLVKTPDMEINRFYNVWSKYQVKNMSRFVHGLDKIGYRDVLQHLLGINSFNPEFVAAHLPTVLRYQYPDGRAMRQFARFENTSHDLRMYMDSSSWIADTLVEYVKETGDTELLEREEGFYNPETGRVETEPKATIYEHALRGLKTLYQHRNTSNGLCMIGHGDWNDALDEVGGDGEGVSVWLSMALAYAARKFRELTVWRNDTENTKFLDSIINDMTETINSNAWDGGHYVYAFMPDGTPVGSSRNEEGKIHMNVNTWSLFNGVAEKGGHVEQVLRDVSKLNTPLGHLMLYPAYTHKSRFVGRIADIVPGLFDNGSVYTHSQSFLLYALAVMGRGDQAFIEMKKCLPGATVPDIATGPLHQISNYAVAPNHQHFGRNHYSNFSGSVAWLRKTLDRMFGVLADFDSLVIDPCIPSDWKSYEVVKHFRSCRVNAIFHNPDSVNSGVVSASLDGKALPVQDRKLRIPAGMLKGLDQAKLEVILGE